MVQAALTRALVLQCSQALIGHVALSGSARRA